MKQKIKTSQIDLNTTSFGNILSSADDTVQKALDTLDNLETGPTLQIKSANYTAACGDLLACDTSSGAFTITLPSSPSAEDMIEWLDYKGTFSTNSLTFGGGENNLKFNDTTDTTLEIDISNARGQIRYDGTNWVVT